MIHGDIETTEKVEYEDLLKNYYEKMEIIEEQDKEIERLTAESTEWESKCYKYQDIIKEVREYIEEMQVYCIEFESWGVPSKELLEILNKEND